MDAVAPTQFGTSQPGKRRSREQRGAQVPRSRFPKPNSSRRRIFAGWVAISGLLAATSALAAVDLIAASPDITLALVPGGGADLVTDQDVVVDNLLGVIGEESLGNSVASQAPLEIVGYHDEGGSRRLLVSTTAVALLGTVPSPGDIVRFNGSTYSVLFDASLEGIPAGVEIDAVTRANDGRLVISLDTFVDFGAFTAADEDLVGFDGGLFSLLFDGSDFGVPAALDLDAVSFDGAGKLFVSFDTGGEIDGVTFADEDVLEFDPVTKTWAENLAFDASLEASGGSAAEWAPADLQAMHVPEPGFAAGLAAGGLVIARGVRRRRHV